MALDFGPDVTDASSILGDDVTSVQDIAAAIRKAVRERNWYAAEMSRYAAENASILNCMKLRHMEMSLETLLRNLDEDGKIGSDMSPGDATARTAAYVIRALIQEMHEIEQTCGIALGYPWYKDDQANFPGADASAGVCTGDHVPVTIVQELADRYTAQRTAQQASAQEPDTK